MLKSGHTYLLISLILLSISGKAYSQDTNLTLKPDTSFLLHEVSVEAYKVVGRLHTVPGSLSVLTGSEMNFSDGNSLATIINTLPGITMQSGTYATSRIVIRGMGSRTPYNSNRIRAYLNEIPLTTADGISSPEEIDLQGIGQMEIIKGPSSALYGSGLGGSINLFTPVKLKNEGSISLQYESFNTLKAGLSGTLNKGATSLWGNISHFQSSGFRENNKYARTSLLSTLKWKKQRLAVNSTLLFTAVDGQIPSSVGKTLFENNPKAAAPNWKEIKGYKKYLKGLAALSLTNTPGTNFSNRLTVFGKLNDDYEKRPFNNLDDQSFSGGFRDKLNYHTARTDFIAGMEWIAELYEWKLDLNRQLINENRENRRQLNIFSMFYYRPVPKLNISVAGAINHISYRLTDLYLLNGDQSGKRKFPLIISPRIGINYAPDDRMAVYASAGHGFSLPSPEETLLPEGNVNPGIKPEQGIQYEAGLRLNIFGNRIGIDAAFYWIELNNLILTKRITEDIFTGINAGKTRHQGFELTLQSLIFDNEAFPGKLASTLSGTFSINRFIDFIDDGNVYNGNYLPGIPSQSIQLQLKWDPVKMIELVALVQYSGYQYLNDSNTLRYPGYGLGNLKASWNVDPSEKSLKIYAGINNVGNTKYASMLIVNAIAFGIAEPRYYYPGLPRSFYAGIQFDF